VPRSNFVQRFVASLATTAAAVVVAVSLVLFVGPVRDWFFNANLIPVRLPADVTASDITTMAWLARPGDVVVESNIHYWQWVGLSKLTTGSTWVHTSLVDERRQLLTVDNSVVDVPLSIFLKWESTRLALVRPPYAGPGAVRRAIGYARSKLGTPYDPSFHDPSGSCTGLVATALAAGGISVPKTTVFGHDIYAAASFFAIPGARVLWATR